nr:MAG TPA: hypothetical protein [Caudoviricetes sp.]DAR80241.1 MAG TPA: hypothetical protein [Caudoviricetes sp.]
MHRCDSNPRRNQCSPKGYKFYCSPHVTASSRPIVLFLRGIPGRLRLGA